MRLLVEGRDLHITDVTFGMRFDGVDADHVADDFDVERIVPALAHDGKRDRRIDRSAHFLDRLLERQTRDRLVVEMRDQVIRHQASLGGGRVVDGRDNLDDAVLHRDLDAETAEFTARLDLHVPEILRAHVGGMRIERRQHAVDRGLR